jgi:two-component system, NarL family, captular synthesis response regulator RcsB
MTARSTLAGRSLPTALPLYASRSEPVHSMTDITEMTAPVRVIVADDHPLVLFALESLIASFPNLQIVARAQTMQQLFEEAARQDFDLVLVDLHMPGQEGDEGHDGLRRFRQRFAQKAVVVLTMETNAAALREAVELDVDAVLSKRDRIDLIPVAIASAIAHEHYVGPVVRDLLVQASRAQRREQVHQILSRRELEVFTHYVSGLGVTEIASLLGRSVKTISAQKCAAMKKLSLGNDVELYRFAVECGVAEDEPS